MSHWWKHFVRGVENVFHGMTGQAPIGASNQGVNATPTSSGTPPPMGGPASSNAGEGVVNFQTKGAPGMRNPGQPNVVPPQNPGS